MGDATYRGLFRDSQNRVLHFYVADCGFAINNEAEFNAVKHDLLIA